MILLRIFIGSTSLTAPGGWVDHACCHVLSCALIGSHRTPDAPIGWPDHVTRYIKVLSAKYAPTVVVTCRFSADGFAVAEQSPEICR